MPWTIQTCWRAPYGNGEHRQSLFERSWETTFYRLMQRSGWDELVPPGTELSVLQALREQVVRGIEGAAPRMPPAEPGGVALARTKAILLGRLDTRIALRRGQPSLQLRVVRPRQTADVAEEVGQGRDGS